jgi:multiple sugar transport system ATP-binding protein
MGSVTFEHVTKRFGDVIAVNDLSLEIQDKEFLVLVGPSGCGKTTALRLLAGLEEVTEGIIKIGERVVNDVQPKDRDIAMVFQSYALYPHMTVFDNMAFGLKLRKMPKEEIVAKVQEAAEILDIEMLLARKPKQLSGGQRQRVAVGRAIVRNPDVFLMDEPLSNLDAKLRGQARAEITKLHRRLETTFIYVTHDQMEAMTMGDRIAVLKDGLLQQLDTPQRLYDNPANRFVAGFIGTPPMNFFDVTMVGENGELSVDSGLFKLRVSPRHRETLAKYAGKEVVLGLRPEDIHDKEFAPPVSFSQSMTARVDVMEAMGNEVFVHLQGPVDDFVARMDPRTSAKVGTEMACSVNMDNMHVFDKETEETIV